MRLLTRPCGYSLKVIKRDISRTKTYMRIQATIYAHARSPVTWFAVESKSACSFLISSCCCAAANVDAPARKKPRAVPAN